MVFLHALKKCFGTKNGLADKKLVLKNVLIPWYPISYLILFKT